MNKVLDVVKSSRSENQHQKKKKGEQLCGLGLRDCSDSLIFPWLICGLAWEDNEGVMYGVCTAVGDG